MHRIRNGVLGVVLVLAVLIAATPAGPARAATLTSAQVSAIIGLLNVFGADASTVSQVQAALTGQGGGAGTPPSQGQASSTRPWQGGDNDHGAGQPGGVRSAVVNGVVTANTGSLIVVQATNGTSTVLTVTASTTVQVFATSTASTTQPVQPTAGTIASILVGMKIAADGTVGANGNITAVHIRVGALPPPPAPGAGQNNPNRPDGRGDDHTNNGNGNGLGKPLCSLLNRDLGLGSRGDDVAQLQQLLAQDPDTHFSATSTGYFGKLTVDALARFQRAHGVASTTGSVGSLVHTFFDQRCGSSTPQH